MEYVPVARDGLAHAYPLQPLPFDAEDGDRVTLLLRLNHLRGATMGRGTPRFASQLTDAAGRYVPLTA